MSFKRDSDDKSQLNVLKKRRVADLLSNFIPEDEAALMKNGRYTCLVCSYRPVFDTVDILTVHRKGRRHLDGLKAFYGKKTHLKNEITKRQHESYVQAEDGGQEPPGSAPLLAQTRRLTHHALLKTAPYSSCHRKRSTKSEKGATSVGSRDEMCPKAQVSPSGSAAVDRESNPSAVTQEAEPPSAQRRKELEHYLKLKSDGWIRDPSGRWIKDENVEFDSDEEEAPPLSH